MDDPYLGFIGAGLGVGIANFLLAWRRAGLPFGWRVLALVAATIASGLFGARAYALIEQGGRWDLIGTVDGGFRLPGGVIGLLIGLGLWRTFFLPGVRAGLIADLGAIASQFGLAVVRLGCLAAGCCFGTVSDLPWAIRFPLGTQAATVHLSLGLIGPGATASLAVHPLQIYFMLLHLAVGGLLLWFERRKAYDGQLLLLGLLLGQGGKALLEGFRQPIPGVPVLHLRVASAVLAAAAAVALVAMSVRMRRRASGRQGRSAPETAAAPG
jgi:phosphatidylglycerol---prolipoprotein diacylglyceryl transferase